MNPNNKAIIDQIRGEGKALTMAQINDMMEAARMEEKVQLPENGFKVFFGPKIPPVIKAMFDPIIVICDQLNYAAQFVPAPEDLVEVLDEAELADPDATLDLPFPDAPIVAPPVEAEAPAPQVRTRPRPVPVT